MCLKAAETECTNVQHRAFLCHRWKTYGAKTKHISIVVLHCLTRKPAPATQDMTHRVLTEIAASISKLKANPMTVVSSDNGMPIAVLNHNESVFYCVPAAAYEALMELIDDAELLKLVKERANGPAVRVTLDEL